MPVLEGFPIFINEALWWQDHLGATKQQYFTSKP
jgi:hypothetical protein